MDRRKSVIAGIVILMAAILLAWFLASGETEQASRQAPVEIVQVPTIIASPGPVANRIHFTGRVIPETRFDIFSEVTGRLESSSKPFKAGTSYRRGEVLLRINNDEQRQQLESARHAFSALISGVLPDINIDYPEAYPEWEQYLLNFDATTRLEPLPEVESRQLRLFLNGRNIYSRFSNVREQEVRLSKFTIEAPFDGVVTESTVDPGALVQPNQRLGEFTKLNPLEIEASIPARQAQYIRVGDQIELRFDRAELSTISARVDRKNAKIDPSNQSVKIYIKVSGGDFRPGTYVEGSIAGNTFPDAVKIHQDALVRESQIFVIRDSLATLRRVNVLNQAGDSVTISDLEPGTVIIDDFRNAAFEGTKVAPLEDQ